MFSKTKAKWDLRRRVKDLEATSDDHGDVLQRHVRKTRADMELLELDLKKLRGRVTGGIRHPESNGRLTVDEIDDQIRRGTYSDVP